MYASKVRHMPEQALLHPWEWVDKPWSQLHVDFMALMLVLVDSYSKWLVVKNFRKVLGWLNGITLIIITDNYYIVPFSNQS